MARSYRPVVRDQEFLLPPNMADWLPEDHLVWFVIDVVDRLETSRFHAGRRTGGAGRQGYDPDMLLGLLVYAYAVGERSSRRIERLCVDHVAFRVLCGQDPPDHSTIARFRAEHHEAFADLFAQVLRLCAAAGMVQVGVVSIDGTKIAANAAKSANRSPEWIRSQAKRIAAEVLAEAEATDAREDATAVEHGGGDGLPPGVDGRTGRRAAIEKALTEVERQDAERTEADVADRAGVEEFLTKVESGEPPLGVPPAGTDPVRFHRARIVRQQRRLADLADLRGVEASRARRDATQILRKAERALAQAQAQAASGELDLRGLAARARDRRAARGRGRGALGEVVNTTDPESRLMTEGAGGGSVQGFNAQIAVTDDHLILGVHLSQDANDTHCWTPTLQAAAAQATVLGKDIETVLADAGYCTHANLTAPGPDRLIATGKNREIAHAARNQPAHRPPPAGLDAVGAMRHRLREPKNAERYKRRSATVEPVIAHLKDQTGLRRFARRGIRAATAELNLAAAVINLTRLHRAGLPTS